MTARVPILEARNLGRQVGDAALATDVDLVLHPGESVVLTGPTGAGKTVLLRLIAALDEPDTGDLRWRGLPVKPNDVPRYRSDVVYLHQTPVLTEGTVGDNLQAPFTFHIHRHRRFDRDEVIRLLSAFGRTAGFLDSEVGSLSGGERQIAALVRAMQFGPSALLLDEPTAALDAGTTEELERVIERWRCDGERATVWVTHDSAQQERVATRTLRMERGRLQPTDATSGAQSE